MSFAQSVRSSIPLVIGLAVGGVGATLFLESMPGAGGSPEERTNKLELALKQAQNRIVALEAAQSAERRLPGKEGSIRGVGSSPVRGQSLADGARRIAEDLREGKPVNPEDIFRASKPLLRDLAPLFDRMRLKQQREMIDGLTGELARKYNLTPQNRESLKQWFEEKASEESKRWSEMLGREDTRLEDLMRASRDVRPDEGLDTFMQGMLSSDKLAAFNKERMAERTQRVQQEADTRVQRLDSIVGLDDAQRDQVFGIMVRGSRDYDPAMVPEGARGAIGATPAGDRQAALLAVLRPDQRAAYEAESQRRRAEAAKNMEAVGLALPQGWEMLEEGDFR
jgi:hypothetical protein